MRTLKPITNLLLFFAIFLTFQYELLAKEKKSSKKVKNISFNFSLASQYDNNILRYSDKYIDRFLNEEDEGRFHINTYDDLTFPINGKLSYRKRISKGFIATFSSEYSAKFYTQNSIKNWYSFQVSWRQTIYSKTEFHIYYNYLPNFYVRHYRDEDWVNEFGYTSNSFQPFDFSKESYNFWIQQKVSKTTKIRTYFSLSNYFYNRHFTEYDSKDWLFGLRVYQNISKKLKFNGGYKYTFSNAKGYDQSNEKKENSDDVDPTYNEHLFFTSAIVTLPNFNKMKNSLEFNSKVTRRIYKSNKSAEIDLLHAGRKDTNYSFGLEYLLQPYKKVNLSFYFDWNSRKANSDFELNEEIISEEKNFSQILIGLKFQYKINF